jgi:hypothetical protein
MSTIMTASNQWATRPSDQRFCSLDELVEHTNYQRSISGSKVIPTRRGGQLMLEARPVEDDASRRQLVVCGPDGIPACPTHWSFGQLANRVGAPAGYLRSLPSDIAADCLNHGVFKHRVEDMGVLVRRDPDTHIIELAAATGPNYGRIWNSEIATLLRDRFGDGVTGDFTVPGEFGHAVTPTKDNTTIYASDRDMFVFLADEKNRIEIPNRRAGRGGSLARGFFVWNSEVGSKTFGVATFLFDYVCMNRIVWGAEGYEEINVRHTVSAPEKWLEEVAPAIQSYANKSSDSITDAVVKAQQARIDDDKVDDFLRARFTRNQAQAIKAVHMTEEERPIETLWDVTTAATAYARGIQYQDERVDIERAAGKVMALAK